MIESASPYWNFKYARDIKGADIDTHARVIMDSNNIRFIKSFAEEVDSTYTEEFKKIVKLPLQTTKEKEIKKLLNHKYRN